MEPGADLAQLRPAIGMVPFALLFAMVQDRKPQEILALDIPGTFAQLGLENHISMNRRNGFYAMTERIKGMAQAAAEG
mgnify:CR=1 FL=1